MVTHDAQPRPAPPRPAGGERGGVATVRTVRTVRTRTKSSYINGLAGINLRTVGAVMRTVRTVAPLDLALSAGG